MKKLRNIAIYYIVLGLISIPLFVFEFLWPLLMFGIILFIVQLLINSNVKVKTTPSKLSKTKQIFWNFLFYLHPLLLIGLVFWYYTKPFKQIIVLPKGYEGVVVIKYDRKDGQSKKWFRDSRLIKVDANGFAKTQFGYDKLIDVYLYSNRLGNIVSNVTTDGMQIYYDDFNKQMEQYQGGDVSENQESSFNQFIDYDEFFSWMKTNEEQTSFVVFNNRNYNSFFYTNSELKKLKINLENSNLSDSLRVEYQDQIKILQKK